MVLFAKLTDACSLGWQRKNAFKETPDWVALRMPSFFGKPKQSAPFSLLRLSGLVKKLASFLDASASGPARFSETQLGAISEGVNRWGSRFLGMRPGVFAIFSGAELFAQPPSALIDWESPLTLIEREIAKEWRIEAPDALTLAKALSRKLPGRSDVLGRLLSSLEESAIGISLDSSPSSKSGASRRL